MPKISQLMGCFIGEQFSEDDKDSLRKDVCKDLPVEFEHDGKFYCVLHFPNNQKWSKTNFSYVVKQRIENQENNFYGVYFAGKTNYFFTHRFETDANFEMTYFEDAYFRKAKFSKTVTFDFANLQRADFQECQFHDSSFFIGVTFASETYQYQDHLAINFSAAIFADAVFQDSIFNKHPHFNDNVFEQASFLRTKFLKGSSFFSTIFKQKVSFSRAIFSGITNFNNSTFDCDERSKDSAKKKSFHITSIFRNAHFQEVHFTKTVFESVDFQEVIFDEVQFWESTFNGLASFESATFNSIDFFQVKFLNEVHFNKVKFKGKGGFFWSEFKDNVQFNKAVFEDKCDILFNFTAFCQLIDFNSANVSGYLSFNGSDEEKVFFDQTDLNLEYIRIENPEKVSFHTLELHPYWFINVDSRKFNFANIHWGKDFGKRNYKTNEIKRISVRGNKNSEQIFKIACRQLAENAENNNRFEEASKFRRMAFETERLERKEKQNKWWNEEFLCSKIFGICLSKLKTAPYDLAHFLYRVSSYYGESSIQAFLVLAGIICFSAFLYWTPLSQFPIPNTETFRSLGFLESVFYSLRVMVLQRPEPFPMNTFGKAVLALESVFAPTQLALLALAVRRKFMR